MKFLFPRHLIIILNNNFNLIDQKIAHNYYICDKDIIILDLMNYSTFKLHGYLENLTCVANRPNYTVQNLINY